MEPEVRGDVNALEVVPIVTTLKEFNKVVNSCFSIRKVDQEYSQHFESFEKVYRSTNLSTTLKTHVVFSHITPTLANLGGRGLGIVSEQAGESIHRVFLEKFFGKKG